MPQPDLATVKPGSLLFPTRHGSNHDKGLSQNPRLREAEDLARSARKDPLEKPQDVPELFKALRLARLDDQIFVQDRQAQDVSSFGTKGPSKRRCGTQTRQRHNSAATIQSVTIRHPVIITLIFSFNSHCRLGRVPDALDTALNDAFLSRLSLNFFFNMFPLLPERSEGMSCAKAVPRVIVQRLPRRLTLTSRDTQFRSGSLGAITVNADTRRMMMDTIAEGQGEVNEEEFEYGDGRNDDEDNEDEGHEDEGIEEDDDRKMYEDKGGRGAGQLRRFGVRFQSGEFEPAIQFLVAESMPCWAGGVFPFP
ncbi:hypothetical protein B0H14DRAFT_2602865 [Mycena olivaceomarginata]|nr:hypothetical protein B0H14DRAFT_2602865 [Mycena olivaceomarginata]